MILKNKFEALNNLNEVTDIEEHWAGIRLTWQETCEESLGRKKTERKVWIIEGTWKKIEERKSTKEKLNSAKTRASIARYQKQYHELHKEVKIRVRQDKRCYYEELAQEAQEAAERRYLREL